MEGAMNAVRIAFLEYAGAIEKEQLLREDRSLSG
jgi:hypothetical protein